MKLENLTFFETPLHNDDYYNHRSTYNIDKDKEHLNTNKIQIPLNQSF